MRLSAIPGLPPLLATAGLLVAWEIAARTLDISGLPPAHAALARIARHPHRQGIAAQHSRLDPPHGDRLCARARLRGAGRPDDGALALRRGVLQSAADDHLSGAEGRADADHHALARRRRCLEDAGDLPRRQPAGDLSQLSGRARRGRKDAVVRRRHGHGACGAARARRVSRRAARDHGRHPHRAGARADHDGDERDDRAQAGRRRSSVQRARDGAVRNRLRHHHHHRHARLHHRRRLRAAARARGRVGGADAPRSRSARHDGAAHRRDRGRHPADRDGARALAGRRRVGRRAAGAAAGARRGVRAADRADGKPPVPGERRRSRSTACSRAFRSR